MKEHKKCMTVHPDKGGSKDDFTRLGIAYNNMLAKVKNNAAPGPEQSNDAGRLTIKNGDPDEDPVITTEEQSINNNANPPVVAQRDENAGQLAIKNGDPDEDPVITTEEQSINNNAVSGCVDDMTTTYGSEGGGSCANLQRRIAYSKSNPKPGQRQALEKVCAGDAGKHCKKSCSEYGQPCPANPPAVEQSDENREDQSVNNKANPPLAIENFKSIGTTTAAAAAYNGKPDEADAHFGSDGTTTCATLVSVHEILMYCTCWWYSLYNFPYRSYRSLYEKTGSDHLDC